MNNYIEFTPKYSPKFQAKHLDSLHFQWSGIDENGEWIMYNNIAGVIEEGNEMYIQWNGTRYNAYEFLYCDHLDGNFSMDSVRVYRVVDGKNTKIY
jgi:hypothetical protein